MSDQVTNIINLPPEDERGGLPSASKLALLMECPGQRQLEELLRMEGKIGPKPLGEDMAKAAERGQRIHRARETNSPIDLEPEELAIFERGKKLEVEAWEEWRSWQGIEAANEMAHEERLWLNHPQSLTPIASARFDIHYVGTRKLTGRNAVLIIDWKTGSGFYTKPARHNWQLKLQAVLAWKEYDATDVRVALNLMEAYPPRVDYFDLTGEDIQRAYAEMIDGIDRTMQIGAPRHATPMCNMCPCKQFCPEAVGMTLLPTIMANVTVQPDRKLPSEEEIKALVQRLGPEDWAYIFRRKSTIEKVLDAVKEELAKLTDDQLNRLGINRGKGQSRRSIPAEATRPAIETLVGAGIPEEDAWKLLTLNLTAAKEYVQLTQQLSEDKAKAWVQAKLEQFIKVNVGEPILRPAKG